MNSMNIDDLPNEKIMELYQNIGIMLGLDLVKNMLIGKETFSKIEIDEFCVKRKKQLEKLIEEFMIDNDINKDEIMEMV